MNVKLYDGGWNHGQSGVCHQSALLPAILHVWAIVVRTSLLLVMSLTGFALLEHLVVLILELG